MKRVHLVMPARVLAGYPVHPVPVQRVGLLRGFDACDTCAALLTVQVLHLESIPDRLCELCALDGPTWLALTEPACEEQRHG